MTELRDIHILTIRGRTAPIEDQKRACAALLKYGKEQGDALAFSYAYYFKAQQSITVGNVKKLYTYAIQASNYLEQQIERDSWLQKHVYNLLGIVSVDQGNLLTALDYYWKIFDCLSQEDEPDYKIYRNVEINIGNVYVELKEYRKGLSYYRRAQKYQNKLKGGPRYHIAQMIIYLNTISCLLELHNFKNAHQYFTKARILSEAQLCTKHLRYSLAIKGYMLDCAIGNPNAGAWLKELMEFPTSSDMFSDMEQLIEELLRQKEYEACEKALSYLESYANKQNINQQRHKALQLKLRYLTEINASKEFGAICVELHKLHVMLEEEDVAVKRHSLNTYMAVKEQEMQHNELMRNQELFRRRSEMDALTMLANRYRFNEYCEEIFPHAIKNKLMISIEIIDVDFFKQYNDCYGHVEGDKCLKTIAETIKNILGENDLAVRYGGDEFLIVRIQRTQAELHALAAHLRTNIEQLCIPHACSAAASFVTISQGVINAVPQPGDTVKDFLCAADAALYEAKKKSRNTAVLVQTLLPLK